MSCKLLNYKKLGECDESAQSTSQKNGYSLSNCAHNAITWYSGSLRQGKSVLRIALTILVLSLVACSGVPTTFDPTYPISAEEFSSDLFDKSLRVHVHDGEVDYPAIKKDPGFIKYLDQLNRVDPNQLTHDDRLAFWINAYNAFAIQGILDGLTPATYVGWYRYFKGREYGVGGRRLTLSDVEHEIIRKQFHDPRVHFAIVCASVSCPKLQNWTYEGARLNQQLDQVAREFINDPTKNRISRMTKTLHLSKIFDWFTEDFIAQTGSLQKYLAPYVADAELAKDLTVTPYHIEYLDYDWSLNGTPPESLVSGRTM